MKETASDLARLRAPRVLPLASAALLFAFAAAVSAETLNFQLGTWVYAGSLLDYRHEVVDASSGLAVQALAEDGTVLAECPVQDPNDAGTNFRLEVPVSTRATAKSAAVGDAPACVVVSPSGTRSAAAFPAIEAASGVAHCTVVHCNAREFAYGDGSVLVSEEYLDGIAYWMEANGRDEYDPAADWDGDGRNNYQEFVAGTNPFDGSDYLVIRDFEEDPDTGIQAITFEYVGGHLYALSVTEGVTAPAWMDVPFATAPEAAAASARTTVHFPDPDDLGHATLYVMPATDSPQRFYRVKVK